MSDAVELAAAIRAGDRRALARAITLVESSRPADDADAQRLLQELNEDIGGAHRIGISGMPGVGKSTFIDAFGTFLLEQGYRVAVLAVDPSSTVSGGSILGDKTRMATLARDDRAYIRPSPSAQTLGGVSRRTREAMLLCEAAGFDVVLVETVGVGQSETVVSQMVDLFLVLVLPGAGDELQGIKKGILELADLIAVNKADGDLLPAAREAAAQISSALRITRADEAWRPRAVLTSALTGEGLEDLWELMREHRAAAERDGRLADRRRHQRLRWMWSAIEERLMERFRNDPSVAAALGALERAVLDGEVSPTAAAAQLLDRVGDGATAID
jgi:LAO/AO transport system kinase